MDTPSPDRGSATGSPLSDDWCAHHLDYLAPDLALNLHEDYDAEGVYIYEIQADRPFWAGDMIGAAAKIIPPDLRRRIEGRAANAGIVRRPKITPDLMPDWPEAFILYFRKVMRVFTVETPSEFHLDDRIAAHGAILSKAVALCRKEFTAKAARKKII